MIPAAFGLLHPDQVGERDWSLEQIGGVNYASFSGRYMTIGTNSGVVARLMTRSGAIQWRTVLPGNERVDAFALHKKTVLTFSKETKKASMWQSVDGSLLWDAILPGASGPSETSDSVVARILDETDIDADGIDDIAIVVGSKAYLLSGAKKVT